MRPIFAIYALSPDGQPFWIESVDNFDDARKRLREVARNIAGDCFIYSVKGGVEELINSDFQERLSKAYSSRESGIAL